MRLAGLCLIGAVCGLLPHPALAQAIDPLEGRLVAHIRVSGLRHLPSDVVERHLVTRVGAPFRRADLAADQRRLDELRLFSAVLIEPRLEGGRGGAGGGGHRNAAAAADRLHPRHGRERLQRRPRPAGHQPPRPRLADGCRGPFRRRDRRVGDGRRHHDHAGHLEPAPRIQLLQSAATRSTTSTSAPPRPTRASPATGPAAFGPARRPTSCRSTPATPARRSPRTAQTSFPRIGAFLTIDRTDSSTNPRHGWWAEAEIDRLVRRRGVVDVHPRRPAVHAAGGSSRPGDLLARHAADRRGRHQPARVPAVRAGWRQYGARLEPGRADRSQPVHWHARIHLCPPTRSIVLGRGRQRVLGTPARGVRRPRAWRGTTGTICTGSPALDGYGAGLRVQVPFVDLIQPRRGVGRTGTGATATSASRSRPPGSASECADGHAPPCPPSLAAPAAPARQGGAARKVLRLTDGRS